MSWLKRIFAKKVDERQERDLMQVEHYGFWLMYWMLVAAMVIQGVIMDKGEQIIGEWIIFMVTSVFVLAGWVRKGVWSYQSRKVPGVKSYLVYSLIAGIVGAIMGACFAYKRHAENIIIFLTFMAVYAVSIFVVSFLVFLAVGGLAQKRERKLEDLAEDESEEDE